LPLYELSFRLLILCPNLFPIVFEQRDYIKVVVYLSDSSSSKQREDLCCHYSVMIQCQQFHIHLSGLLLLAGIITAVGGQLSPPTNPLKPQTNTFNSNFGLTNAQIASLNLSTTLANNVNIAKQFEETNWATGSVLTDPFYTDLPTTATALTPGSVIKVEEFTDPSNYTIAPAIALSRIIFQSETLNGTAVPVSAIILWPFLARSTPVPLVSWGHGSAGVFAECAPSHMRNVHYQFSAPYTLALQGYAVVAPDFAGLGVSRYPDGTPVIHQFVANPAAGNDLLYAAKAAHAAFPDKLTEEFVVIGHSQGGGAAWGAAQQQTVKKIPGYLGAIAVAPVTNATAQAEVQDTSLGVLQAAQSVVSIFSDVSLSDILQPAGIAIAKLMGEIQGCNSVFHNLLWGLIGENTNLLVGLQIAKPEFLSSYYGRSFQNLTVAGGKDFAGPMLVIQGTDDTFIPESVTTMSVNKTCKLFPEHDLEYLTLAGVSHMALLFATQRLWLDWIAERFAVMENEKCRRSPTTRRSILDARGKGCKYTTVGANTPRPLQEYVPEVNYFLSPGLEPYQVT
jgi:pimeloyl-ACP methyl ester carboxylesterase